MNSYLAFDLDVIDVAFGNGFFTGIYFTLFLLALAALVKSWTE